MPPLLETRARWLSTCDAQNAYYTLCAATQLREQFDLPRSEEEQAEAEEAEMALRLALGDESTNAIRKAISEHSGGAEHIVKQVMSRT